MGREVGSLLGVIEYYKAHTLCMEEGWRMYGGGVQEVYRRHGLSELEFVELMEWLES